MGVLELLTIVFVVLKLMGVIAWSWIWVVSPMYPALLVYAAVIAFQVCVFKKVSKEIKRF